MKQPETMSPIAAPLAGTRRGPFIRRFHFNEVVVPTHPGVVNSVTLNKPLHMLPVGAQRAWSVQFDELPKLVLRLELSNGVIGLGEFYRDHQWPLIQAASEGLLGADLSALTL